MLLITAHDGSSHLALPRERRHGILPPIRDEKLKYPTHGEPYVRVTRVCGCIYHTNSLETRLWMSGKKIDEMSDQELLEEIERMRAVPVPASPVRRTPKRLDETAPRKKRGWMDDVFGDET